MAICFSLRGGEEITVPEGVQMKSFGSLHKSHRFPGIPRAFHCSRGSVSPRARSINDLVQRIFDDAFGPERLQLGDNLAHDFLVNDRFDGRPFERFAGGGGQGGYGVTSKLRFPSFTFSSTSSSIRSHPQMDQRPSLYSWDISKSRR